MWFQRKKQTRRNLSATPTGHSRWSVPALALWLGANACGGPSNLDYAYEKEPDPRRSGYRIGALDLLRVNVWKDPDLSSDVQVRPDGRITLPLVGEIVAEGKTSDEVRQAVVSRLSKFVDGNKAVVTVAVAESLSYYFTVSGHVANPGRYASGTYVTVIEALALAGEPTPYASPQRITILRKDGGGKVRKIPVNYDALINAKQLRQNVAIVRGDVIVVP